MKQIFPKKLSKVQKVDVQHRKRHPKKILKFLKKKILSKPIKCRPTTFHTFFTSIKNCEQKTVMLVFFSMLYKHVLSGISEKADLTPRLSFVPKIVKDFGQKSKF